MRPKNKIYCPERYVTFAYTFDFAFTALRHAIKFTLPKKSFEFDFAFQKIIIWPA